MKVGFEGKKAAACSVCGRELTGGARVCPGCGAAISAARVPRSPQDEIYLMLTTANVLRLRRQWALAEAKCSEVLQLDPENATACSILGSIARDQGRLRDAIQWYRMALEREPGNLSDRKKLEEVIDRVFSTQGKGLAGRARVVFREGLDSVAAQARAARPASPMLLIVWVALAVIIVASVFALLAARGGELRGAQPSPPSPSGAFVTTPAIPERPVPGRAHPSETPRSAHPAFSEDVTALEPQLLSHLREYGRVAHPSYQVLAVEIDPRTGEALLRLAVQRLWLVESMRDSVLEASLGLAQAAARWDERVAVVRVRCLMLQQGVPDQVAFVAEGKAETLANIAVGEEGRAARSFASVWWHPELAMAAPTWSGD
jgi:hypothetical protein